MNDFLAAFVDSSDELSDRPSIPLPQTYYEPMGSALRDSLRILGCKQMKILFSSFTGSNAMALRRVAVAAGGSGVVSGADDGPEVGMSQEEMENEDLKMKAAGGVEAVEAKRQYEMNLLKRNLAFQVCQFGLCV